MLIKMPFRNVEDKTDVQISISMDEIRDFTEKEKESLNKLTEVFTNSTLEYMGKFSTKYISIKKETDCLYIWINDELISNIF